MKITLMIITATFAHSVALNTYLFILLEIDVPVNTIVSMDSQVLSMVSNAGPMSLSILELLRKSNLQKKRTLKKRTTRCRCSL